MLERVDVHLVLRLRDRRGDLLGADLQPVGTARQHRLVGHPHHDRLELIGDTRQVIRSGDDVAATDVDLVGERQRDRLAGNRMIEIAVHSDDARDGAFAARGQHANLVSLLHHAARDRAREAAEIEIRAVDPLHRHAQRALLGVVLDFDGLKVAHQRRTVVPVRVLARVLDVVAAQARHRDRDELLDADLPGERRVVVDDLVEDRLAVADEVHLVDGQHDLADADQRHQVAVPPGLRQHALARVDQDHGEVRAGSAGDHVARVLFVPRRVGDDELALVGREEAVGHVDRDALLAFRGKAIDQQGEVEFAALRSDFLRVRFERGELVLEDHLGVVEQAPDQGALAVVDAAAGDEPQQALVLVRVQVGVNVAGDQVADVCH